MDQKSKKILKLIFLTLVFIMIFVACEKPEPDHYISKREDKIVETPFNSIVEAITEVQIESSDLEIDLEQAQLDLGETQGLDREAFGSERELTVEETGQLPEAIVNTANLNVRSMPTQDSEVVTQLPQGTRVIILATEEVDETTWAYIRTEGFAGYVISDFLDQ